MTAQQRRDGRNVLAIYTVLMLTVGGVIGYVIGARSEEPRQEDRTPQAITYTVPAAAEPEPEPEPESEYTDAGIFKVTAYCPCSECSGKWGRQTSTGATATEGTTVAVDPDVVPYGTVIVLDGQEYIAQDCGGAVKGKHIDLYFDDHDEAEEWGVQYHSIQIKEGQQ